jgi:hypothetical protein
MLGKSELDVPDGQYRIQVQAINHGWKERDGPASVIAAMISCPGDKGEERTRTFPLDEFDEPVAPGMVYQVEIRNERIVNLRHDWEATVQAIAPGQLDDKLLVPLRNVEKRVGSVAEQPGLVSLDPAHSILVAGEPGAGKTEFIKLIATQLQTDPEEPVVVFNYKDDYTEFAEQMATNRVIRLSTQGSTDIWNVFREGASPENVEAALDDLATEEEIAAGLEAQGRENLSNASLSEFETALLHAVDEEDMNSAYGQIGRLLFREQEQTNPKKFFPKTARQVFLATLIYLHREGERSELMPDNRELADFFNRFTASDAYELIQEHEDLRGKVQPMNPQASKQSVGVYATVQSVINDVFAVGDFGRPNGEFSLQEYFASPAGRVLLLDYPLKEGDRLTDVFRVLLSRSIKLALADRTTQATFILDEFPRIPRIDEMEELVATGRARSVQNIIGVQSKSQLAKDYGSTATDSMLSGLTQEVFLRAGDRSTIEYYQFRLADSSADRHGEKPSDCHPTEDSSQLRGHLQRLDDGEGYIVKQDGYAHVTVPMLSQLESETRTVVCDRGRSR